MQYYLSLIITALLFFQGVMSPSQDPDPGKIYFSTTPLTNQGLSKANILDECILYPKTDLFIHLVLDRPLTHSLQKLAPGLDAKMISGLGNFQFSFLVDDSLIYTTNLMPGAPSIGIKDTATRLSLPLIKYNNENGALWSQYAWFRFYYNGGNSVLTDGKHRIKIIAKPYIRIENELRVGESIASGEILLDIRLNEKINTTKITLNKPKTYTDLGVSKDKINVEKMKTLKGLCENGTFKNIQGIVVLKDHKILVEEYFNGAKRNTLHDPRSVGKSFASTALGLAIDKGHIKNEDQVLSQFYSINQYNHYSREKEETTIKDLLTMSSTFDGDDNEDSPGNEENMYPTEDWVKFALDLPISASRPKKEWHYFTAGVVVLGDIINKAVPGGLEKFLDQSLFKPLHISHYKWQYTPQGVANTAGGLQLNALDFAKYGLLYKDNGVWNGKRVLPADWIAKSFSKHRIIPNRDNEYYGYLFWNKTYTINDKQYETYYCTGNGGNKIFVFKDIPVVVVVTASAYNLPYAHPQVDKMMEEYILPAVILN